MDHSIQLPLPDYEADDVLVVRESSGHRALANDFRAKIIGLLRERARSVSQLAEELDVPKGTVGHHMKVLEDAGLVRVVRTRRVRAVTEKFYGRTARLFVVKGEEDPELRATLAEVSLRRAAEEMGQTGDDPMATQSFLHVRLSEEDARRFKRRLDKLADDFRARSTRGGVMHGLLVGFYPLRDE